MFAITLCLSVAAQASAPARSGEVASPQPLSRAYVVGLAGDHDRDRVADYAIAGEVHREGRRRVVVRIRSGADDRLLGEFETRLEPPCEFVTHEPYLSIAGDLDSDGAFELGAWDARGWLLDGRTGAVLRDFGPAARVLGSRGDLDGDGVPDLAIDEPPAGESPAHRVAHRHVRHRSGKDFLVLARPFTADPLERALAQALAEPWIDWLDAGTSRPGALVTIAWEDRLVHVDSVEPFAIVELRELASRAPAWSRDLRIQAASDEHGGLMSFRVASPGDLNGDGLDDIALALPSHALGEGESFCGVLSRADGAVLWRTGSALGFPPTGAVASETLNYGIDRLPDRDADGIPDLLVSHSDPGQLVVLSGRTGEILARADL